jgi:hypothetical protein
MDRFAVFVDAGYLFAQGSALLAGQKQLRKFVKLNEKTAIAELLAVAGKVVDGSVSLLRVYWYDGGHRFPSPEQEILADQDHVKLRLGFINSHGQQKGVDSLIVTDLIELARNGAIADAVVLSGDEDIRVGVQVAQTLGVRVHLIGIHPARGSQSKQLRHESDTCHELDKECVSKFLTVNLPQPKVARHAAQAANVLPAQETAGPSPASAAAQAVAVVAKAAATAAAPVVEPVSARAVSAPDAIPALKSAAAELLATLSDDDVRKIAPFLGQSPGLPGTLDGRLLAKGRSALNRTLTLDERKTARGEFRQIFEVRFKALG